MATHKIKYLRDLGNLREKYGFHATLRSALNDKIGTSFKSSVEYSNFIEISSLCSQ